MSERLPLGIDLGQSRVRVAALAGQGESLRLVGLGCADVTSTPAEALAAALRDLDADQKTAVTMIRTCDASLRSARFPALSNREARRAAYFEGIASFGDEDGPIAVRSMALRHDCGEDRMLIAATPVVAVQQAIAVLMSAGLRASRIDHEGCVLARSRQLPLLDIGLRRSTLVALSGGIPIARTIMLGGIHFTNALADELGIDAEMAELRKRTIGLGGAGSVALGEFCATVASELAALRDGEGIATAHLYVSGNGARLPQIIPALERTLAIRISPVVLRDLLATDLPDQAATFAALDSFNAIVAAIPNQMSARAVA